VSNSSRCGVKGKEVCIAKKEAGGGEVYFAGVRRGFEGLRLKKQGRVKVNIRVIGKL
jgi:hypothetical protein